MLPYVIGKGETAAPQPDAGPSGNTAASPLLVIAQPYAEGLPPLRFAEQEAQTIAALYGAQPIIGDAATEAALRSQAPGHRLIHIAAHGQLNAKSSLFSRLILASQAEDDGALEVHEVYGLDLTHADMVTLSACQTQLGSQSNGDDVVGLSRAFIYAGAPTVVASLWSVDDEATAGLMLGILHPPEKRHGQGRSAARSAVRPAPRRDAPAVGTPLLLGCVHPDGGPGRGWQAVGGFRDTAGVDAVGRRERGGCNAGGRWTRRGTLAQTAAQPFGRMSRWG